MSYEYIRRPSPGVEEAIQSALRAHFFLVQTLGPTLFLLQTRPNLTHTDTHDQDGDEDIDRSGRTAVGVARSLSEPLQVRVSLGEEGHSCSCRSPTIPCAHILFVLLRIFRLSPDNPLVWQTRLHERQIEEIVSFVAASPVVQRRAQPATMRGSTASGAEYPVPRKPVFEGDDLCPICQEPLTQQPNEKFRPLTFCRSGCGNNLHVGCMEVWIQHRESTRQEVTCPLCRCIWTSRDLMQLRADKHARKTGSKYGQKTKKKKKKMKKGEGEADGSDGEEGEEGTTGLSAFAAIGIPLVPRSTGMMSGRAPRGITRGMSSSNVEITSAIGLVRDAIRSRDQGAGSPTISGRGIESVIDDGDSDGGDDTILAVDTRISIDEKDRWGVKKAEGKRINPTQPCRGLTSTQAMSIGRPASDMMDTMDELDEMDMGELEVSGHARRDGFYAAALSREKEAKRPMKRPMTRSSKVVRKGLSMKGPIPSITEHHDTLHYGDRNLNVVVHGDEFEALDIVDAHSSLMGVGSDHHRVHVHRASVPRSSKQLKTKAGKLRKGSCLPRVTSPYRFQEQPNPFFV